MTRGGQSVQKGYPVLAGTLGESRYVFLGAK